ncbi:hypothetical protein CJU89_2097 [Yarrowia sp. B02]|nr:hypothetical protein CJU89_2097 [Yarrowia sp. B02]
MSVINKDLEKMGYSEMLAEEKPCDIYSDNPENQPIDPSMSTVFPVIVRADTSLCTDMRNLTLNVPTVLSFDCSGDSDVTTIVTKVDKEVPLHPGDILDGLSGLDGWETSTPAPCCVTKPWPDVVRLETCEEEESVKEEAEKMKDEKVKGDEPDSDAIYFKRLHYGQKLLLAELRATRKELQKQLSDLKEAKARQDKQHRDVKAALAPFHGWACDGVES